MSYTHQENVVIYALGLLHELSDSGLVAKGGVQLAKKGLDRFHELKDQGFKPTERELKVALHVIQSECVS